MKSSNQSNFYPKIKLLWKNDSQKGIYIYDKEIHFVHCLGSRGDESAEIKIADIGYIKHQAKYKLFVLEGMSVNEAQNLIIFADKDEKPMLEIEISKFTSSVLRSFLEAIYGIKKDIVVDVPVKMILKKKSFAEVNWRFFNSIVRGIRLYFLFLLIYTIVKIIRNQKLTIFITALVISLLIFVFIYFKL